MKNFFQVAGFLIFLGLCAWGLGVRVHPEVLSDSFPQNTKRYYRLDLTNGKTLTGEIIRKNAEMVYFKSEGVSLNFMNFEIEKLTPLGNSLPVEEGRFSHKPRWITFSLEDGWVSRFLPSSKKAASSASQGASFFDFFTPSMPLNMLTHAKSQLKKAAETRAQSQST